MKNDLGIRAESRTTLLGYALDEFILNAQSRQLAPASIKFYRKYLNPFVAYCAEQGAPDLHLVTAFHSWSTV